MPSKVELEAIAKILNTLNFYQILKVSPVASTQEIQQAFHREALQFHPDRYAADQDPEVRDLAKLIYGRVVEAYRTLSNRTKRESYDRDRDYRNALDNKTSNPEPSSGVDEDAVTSVRQKASGPTASAGNKFFRLAASAFSTRDLTSAKMNIQIALNTDPKNPEFIQLLQRIETELKKAKK